MKQSTTPFHRAARTPSSRDLHRGRTLAVVPAMVFILALASLAPATAQAQERYNFTASLAAGLAGSTDADPGDGLDNVNLQLGVNFVTEPRTRLALRLGRFDLDSEDRFGTLRNAELTYATVAGEYRFREKFYESGLFLGLGAYQLDGESLFPGGEDDETAVGVNLGALGEFELSRRFSVLVELSGHYVDFDQDANVFAMGLVGLAYHF